VVAVARAGLSHVDSHPGPDGVSQSAVPRAVYLVARGGSSVADAMNTAYLNVAIAPSLTIPKLQRY